MSTEVFSPLDLAQRIPTFSVADISVPDVSPDADGARDDVLDTLLAAEARVRVIVNRMK